MKVLVFYQYFGTPKGGWSTRMYELPKCWIKAGHQVTIVTSPYDKSDIRASQFIDKQFFDGIEVIIVNIRQSNKHSIVYRAFTFCLFSFISIYYALTRKFDIVLCSSGPITIGLPGLFAKFFRRKIKFVFEVRDLWPDGAIQLGLIKSRTLIRLAYSFEKLCYNKADLIVTCSDGMTDSIRQRFTRKNLLTIPNACDNLFFNEFDPSFKLPLWAVSKKIFVYTGSLGLMDDCMQIVRAIELTDITDEVFVFIGEGKEKVALEQYVNDNKIKHIFFTGLIPKTEVRSWLQHSFAAFVTFKNIPMLQTSSPNKMFDAFAAGVPIIQSTTGWIKDLTINESCGISVDPGLPNEMAVAIKTLSNDTSQRNKMSIACKRLAETSFNRSTLAQVYLDELQLLLPGKVARH